MCRLFIIEGLPFSGKSTTVKYVADWLVFGLTADEPFAPKSTKSRARLPKQ